MLATAKRASVRREQRAKSASCLRCLAHTTLATAKVGLTGMASNCAAAAVVFAYKNKMAISIGIAVGSATQISLFLVPGESHQLQMTNQL